LSRLSRRQIGPCHRPCCGSRDRRIRPGRSAPDHVSVDRVGAQRGWRRFPAIRGA